MGKSDARKRRVQGLRLGAAAVLVSGIAGCGVTASLDPTSASAPTPAPAAKPAPKPDLKADPIAKMSAETRYELAVGCATATRLALKATTPEAMGALGMPPEFAAAASVQFASDAERNARVGEAAARDSLAVGADLGKSKEEVVALTESEYARLEKAFAGVAKVQPRLALVTMTSRLKRCAEAYPAG